MKFLANENIPLGSVRHLRSMGHDVLAIAESTPGIVDAEVLTLAHDQQRILLTFDRDYGALVYLQHLPCPAGIIYFRFVPSFPEEPATLLAPLVERATSFLLGGFVVLDREGWRRRPLPVSFPKTNG